MRSFLFIAILFCCGWSYGQGVGFTFTYTGPTQIIVGPPCMAALNWGHPNTPTVTSNIPGGVIVSFTIYSISGGYHINDLVHGGATVTVFYLAVDNFGNNALFGFTISFIDLIPPVFDPLSLPQNITLSCSNNLPPPANVEASDNCGGIDPPLTITYTQTGNVAACAGGTIIRKWVADDDLGNKATFMQTITIVADITPPLIINNLQNGTAPCALAMAQYTTWLQAQRTAFHAIDTGCGVMSLTDNAPSPSQITMFCGVITVTFTAKDLCNNISTVQKTFTVTNSVPPVITVPAAGANGNCGQNNINQIFNNWISSHGGAEATDDCSSVVWTTSPAHPSIHDTCNAAIQVMFIAGDGCGNSATTSASFVLTDNTGPAFTIQPTTSILNCNSPAVDSLLLDWLTKAGHSVAHDLCTADADLRLIYRLAGNDLTLEEVLNAWQDSLLSVCRDNVVISGVGINNVKAYLEVSFVYADKCNNETGATGFFGITDNGRPIFLTLPVNTSFTCSENESWQQAFLDWYNSAGGATYTDMCSAVTLHTSITSDSAIALLSASLDTACLQGVHVTVQFGLEDGCGNTSLTMPGASFSLQDSIPPVFITGASDFISLCSANGDAQLQNWLDTLGGASATDGCGAILWMFSWIDTLGMTVHGVPGQGPYPSTANLDCSTGLEVIFTVSDFCQNSISDTAIFSIIDTIPPLIIVASDFIHLLCGDTIPATHPLITDACTDTLFLSFQDIAGIDSCFGQPNIVVRIWTAIDACGNSSTAQEVFLRIDTIPPTFELPEVVVQFCSIDSLFLINVHDNCDPSPVTSWADVLTGFVCNQLLTRTWTVTDACGNSTTAIQQFDLSDTSPPEITHSPGNFVYSCNGSSIDLQSSYEQWRDSVTIVDGCSASDYFIALRGSYVLEDTTTWPGTPVPDSIFLICSADVSIEADLVAYDICGNVMVDEISFSIIDTTGPVFTSCLAVISVTPDALTCNALVTLVKPGLEDVCFPDSIHLQLQLDGGDPVDMDSILSIDTLLDVGIHNALWIARDCKGNKSICLSRLEIIDENAISLTCPSDTLLFAGENSCATNLWIYPPMTSLGKCGKGEDKLRFEIQGDADQHLGIFSSPADSILVVFAAGVHNVLLIASDSTGDIDTCMYIVELRDTIDPFMVCQKDTLLLPPDGVGDIDLSATSLVVSASDNCSIQNIVYDPPFVNCNHNGQTIDVTITAFDPGGNTVTCVSSLFVTTRTLMPLWERGLCDDTLRLFAHLPPGPDVNYTFIWTGPNAFSSGEENPLIPGADTSANGQYTLTVQSESGCISMGSADINIQTLVSPSITTSDDSICAGEEIILSTQNYSGNVSYQWYQISPSGDSMLTSTPDPSLTLSLSESGSYRFYAVVMQDTCSSASGPELTIFVSLVPSASVLESMIPLCKADSLFLLPQMTDTSLQYHWTGPNGFEAFIPNPPGIAVSETDQGAIYILTASTQFCTSLPDTLIVLIQAPPDIPIITGDSSACEGGMFLLVANSSADQFEWIDPAGNTILTTMDSLLIPSADQTHSGGWQVIAKQNGCPSDSSAGFTIRIDTVTQIHILGQNRVCEDDSILLTVSPAVTGIYSWNGPNGFISDSASLKIPAEEGIYKVNILTPSGCVSEDSFAMNVDILPVIHSLMTDADSCANGMGTIHVTAEIIPANTGMYIYQWNGPSNFNSQDASLEFQNVTAAINGLYSLFIKNGACTSDTAIIELALTDSPAAPIITGEQVYCFGDSIVLGIQSPVVGGVYTWSSSDTIVVVNSPGTLIIPNAHPSFTGIYNVEVTVDGCTSALSLMAVQVKNELAAPAITSPALVCEGDSLVLMTNTNGATVHWSGPNGFESDALRPVIFPATPVNAGFYTVAYTLNGCPSPVSIPKEIIVQSSLMTPGIEADTTRICIDDPAPVHLCLTVESGTPGATYSWLLNGSTAIGTPDTNSCITIEGSPFQGGLNFITVVASLQGCPSDTSNAVMVTADEIPDQQANAGSDIQFCPNETIILNATDPSPSTGVWTSSSDAVVFSDHEYSNSLVNSLPSGEYIMTWTLSFATCLDYSSDSVNIGIIFPPEVYPDTVDVPFGQTVEFVATANDSISTGPYTLQIVSSTQKGNVLHAGNGVFRYTPNIGFVGTDFMTYRICSTECPEECSEAIVVLRVGNEGDCFVPTLFTPNDDGVNDILIIPCLETERYPLNKIIVFNEWGAVVYTSTPYHNDWDGSVSGDPLPVGTYFYIMDFGDGRTPKRTFLVLER